MHLAPRAAAAGLAVLAVIGVRATADPAADAAIARARNAWQGANSLKADIEYVVGDRTYTGRVVLQRPNLARLEMPGYGTEQVVSDGKKVYTYLKSSNTFREVPAPADGKGIFLLSTQLQGFFNPDAAIVIPKDAQVTLAGQETVEGVPCDIVEIQAKAGILRLGQAAQEGQPRPMLTFQTTRRYAVANPGGAILKMTTSATVGERISTSTFTLKRLRVNEPVEAVAFQWKAPEGARVAAVPAPVAARVDYTANLVPVGQAAPDFQLPVPGGNRISLSDEVKKNKVTLLNFWFYG